MNPSPEQRLIDVSRPLAATTACWPGDVPFAFRLGWKIGDGASVNVGAVETSVHAATHCDAPYHYDDTGPTVDRLPLAAFVGPARVVDMRGHAGRWRERLDGLDLGATPRVLFRTGGWPDTTRFPESIPVMEAGLADWLGGRGVVLVGVDLPSVDPLDSKTLDNHHALGRHGIVIVEGLWLEWAPEGRYELIAPPLKLVGADGSPLRALLRAFHDGDAPRQPAS
jgi:arylformamidase